MTLNDIYHAIDPVALSLGPLQIRWYGLAYVAGFICAFLVIAKLSQRWEIRIDDDAFFTVVFCVIFAAITPPMITPTSPPWKLMPPSLNARIFSGC